MRLVSLIRTLLALLVFVGCYGVLPADTARAEFLTSFLSPFSPLVSEPWVAGELKVRARQMRVADGEKRIPSMGLAWDLREDFGLTRDVILADVMFRFQISRLSMRVHLDLTEFSGTEWYRNTPGTFSAEARFEYTGLRIGADLDLLAWGRSRAGLNVDYAAYEPTFTETVQTLGGSRIGDGDRPISVGVHGTFAPGRCFYGVSGVLEGRGRWSVVRTGMSDWEIAGGLILPTTVLGAISLRGGYRRTSLDFTDTQLFNGTHAETEFSIVFDGWFAEFTYLY